MFNRNKNQAPAPKPDPTLDPKYVGLLVTEIKTWLEDREEAGVSPDASVEYVQPEVVQANSVPSHLINTSSKVLGSNALMYWTNTYNAPAPQVPTPPKPE